MDIRVKADQHQLLEQTNDYLYDRLAHIEKLLGEEADTARCEVEIGRDAGRPRHGKNVWYAELQIIYPGGKLIRATNRSESINGAIDDAKAELERQLRSGKKQHEKVTRKGGTIAKGLMRLD